MSPIKWLSSLLLLSLMASAQLPNRSLTPGAIRTTDQAEVCAPSFRTAAYRHTSSGLKKKICAAYGVKNCPQLGTMEIDHLVPLELGGADEPGNLWVQFAKYQDGSPGFHVKDALENELHRKVCHGEMTLPQAQSCLQVNWIRCYQQLVPAK